MTTTVILMVIGVTPGDADGLPLAYVLAPDHLWYLSLQPDGTDRTRIATARHWRRR